MYKLLGVAFKQQPRAHASIEMGFPVYYAGIRPLDSMGRGRVLALYKQVTCRCTAAKCWCTRVS